MKQLDSFFRNRLNYPPPRVMGILLGCLLFFASCGGDDSSDDSYAAVESESFTFDETGAANNAVRVMANGAWQVYWEPASAAVTVDPSAGVGNGTFRVLDMPRGTSVEVGVRSAAGKASGKTITVTRAAASAEVTLSLAPADLRFDPAGTNRITVTSNASWSASCSDPALVFSPASGTGDGTITVTAAPEGVRCTLTVTAGEGPGAKTGNVNITFAGAAGYRWAELPATPADMTGKKIHTFWASTVTTKQYLRNYTYCYDTQRHCPLWIAHPQHACYQEGGTTRPATDPWTRDPSMTETEQAIIYPLAVNNNRAMSLYSESIDKQWIRGHMLASSYRGCGDKNNPAEINTQTFYPGNISPQGRTAFDKVWGDAEKRILDRYVCSDTLYCVSGAYFENDDMVARDASCWNGSGDTRVRYYVPGYSKECIVPTHYYKLLLRTRSGNLRKPIQECAASELKAVGFWFEHADRIGGSSSPTLDKSYLRSVKEIEEKTGFTFFPDVDESVKASYNPADWGF